MARPTYRSALAVALAIGAMLGCGLGRTHPLQEGRYALALQGVLRDDCGLAADSSLFTDGKLSIAGNEVRFSYDLYATPMVGSYQEVSEHFYVDGSVANVQSRLPSGMSCLNDLINLHLEADTVGPQEFDGTLRFSYNSTAAGCTCEFWSSYRAVKQ